MFILNEEFQKLNIHKPNFIFFKIEKMPFLPQLALFIVSIFIIFLNSTSIKKSTSDLLGFGQKCYQSTSEFMYGEKKCEKGLICRYVEPPNGMLGVPKYCLHPIKQIIKLNV